jgi:hypothetical protein
VSDTPVAAVARRLGCTEGQAYTLAIGLVLAIALGVTGIPAVLRPRHAAAAATFPTPFANRATGALPGGSPAGAGPATRTRAAPLTPAPFVPAPASIPPEVAPGTTASNSSGMTAPPPAPQLVAGAPVASPPPGTITEFAAVGPPGAPGGLAVGPDGTVYVTTGNGTSGGDPGPSHVLSFDAQGARVADVTITGQAAGHADGLTGAAVDPADGDVVVLDPDDARILKVDMVSGAQTTVARIPDLPACLVSLGADPCEPGADDHKPFPVAAVYDRQGDLYVTDSAQDTIWRLPPGESAPEVWYQSNDFPVGDGPYGLALDGGSLEFTVGTAVAPSDLDAGGLYRVAIGADGSAGAATLVTAFAEGDEPGSLAVGRSGISYVVLRHTGAIALIGPSGSQSAAIVPPGTGPVPLDAPSALALVPGALLVANQGAGRNAALWAVLAVSERDGPEQ